MRSRINGVVGLYGVDVDRGNLFRQFQANHGDVPEISTSETPGIEYSVCKYSAVRTTQKLSGATRKSGLQIHGTRGIGKVDVLATDHRRGGRLDCGSPICR